MASTILLTSYVGKKEFEEFLNSFYDTVCASDMVKHYFFLAKKNTILQDMRKFSVYLTPKTQLDYRRPATATASPDIQLPDSQLAEISQIMLKGFREKKFSPEHVPQLTHEILEMIDESRSQTNDTAVSILYPDEINSDTVYSFLKKNKIGSEVMPSKSIKAEFGLAHKVWIYLDYEQKTVSIEGKIFIKDTAFDDQIEEIIEKQNNRDTFVKVRLERETGAQHLLERHVLPFRHGMPVRLFVRYLSRFSRDLDLIYSLDPDDILRSG
jgi:hypothetical protein